MSSLPFLLGIKEPAEGFRNWAAAPRRSAAWLKSAALKLPDLASARPIRDTASVRMAREVAKFNRTCPAPPVPKTWPELSATRAWSRNQRAGPDRSATTARPSVALGSPLQAELPAIEPREVSALRPLIFHPRQVFGDQIAEQRPVRVQAAQQHVEPVATGPECFGVGDDAQVARARD